LSGLHNLSGSKSSSPANRNWQLKATYVEVRQVLAKWKAVTDINRSTTSHSATSYFPKTRISTSDHK
jgi:hypothetical protein